MGRESEGADRPGRKGICSGITLILEASSLGQKHTASALMIPAARDTLQLLG